MISASELRLEASNYRDEAAKLAEFTAALRRACQSAGKLPPSATVRQLVRTLELAIAEYDQAVIKLHDAARRLSDAADAVEASDLMMLLLSQPAVDEIVPVPEDISRDLQSLASFDGAQPDHYRNYGVQEALELYRKQQNGNRSTPPRASDAWRKM